MHISCILFLKIIIFFIININSQLSISKFNPISDSCGTNMIRMDNICIKEIIGCQQYKSTTECLKCNIKYQLTNNKCLMVSSVSIDESVKPVIQVNQNQFVIKTQKNTIQKIKRQIIIQFPNITLLQNTQKFYDILKTSGQTYYSFKIKTAKQEQFICQTLVNDKKQIKILIFQKWKQSVESTLFINLHKKLIIKYQQRLKQYYLIRISQISKNLYRLFYMQPHGIQQVAFIQKSPFLQIRPLQILQYNYNQTWILNFIYIQYPQLMYQNQYTITQRKILNNNNGINIINNNANMNSNNYNKNQQYQILFDSNTKIIIQVNNTMSNQNDNLNLKIILYSKGNSILTANKNNGILAPGSARVFQDKNDQFLRKALNYLFTEYDFLKKQQITQIQYQVVAGIIFIVHLTDTMNDNLFTIKVFYSLSGDINILQIYLNSILIQTQPLSPSKKIPQYNYTSDVKFTKVKQFILSKLGIPLQKKILYVNEYRQTKSTNQIVYSYQVIYNQNTYVYVIYNQSKNTFLLEDYVKNGNNYIEIIQNQQARSKVKKLLSENNKIFNTYILSYFKQIKPTEYIMKIITIEGSYIVKVIDNSINNTNINNMNNMNNINNNMNTMNNINSINNLNNKNDKIFQISYYQSIDPLERCTTYSQLQKSNLLQQQKQLLSKISSIYKLPAKTQQLVSIRSCIVNNKVKLRLLYSNKINSKQSQIILTSTQQTNTPINNNNYIISSYKVLNQGYYQITAPQQYNKICNRITIKNSSILSLLAPLSVGYTNDKFNNVYFSGIVQNQQVVYECYENVKTLEVRINKIMNKSVYQSNCINNNNNINTNTNSNTDNTNSDSNTDNNVNNNNINDNNNKNNIISQQCVCNQGLIQFLSSCYQKVIDCKVQIGTQCIQCEKTSTLTNNTCLSQVILTQDTNNIK